MERSSPFKMKLPERSRMRPGCFRCAQLGKEPVTLAEIQADGLGRSADGFIGHHDPAGEQEFFHITVTEAEPIVQPHAVVMISAGKRWCFSRAVSTAVFIRQGSHTLRLLTKWTMP